MRILFTPDTRYLTDGLQGAWTEAMVRTLISDGHNVSFLGRYLKEGWLEQRIRELGAEFLPVEFFGEESVEADAITARYRARQVIRVARLNNYDMVLAQGFSLCQHLSVSQALGQTLWSIVDDDPTRYEFLTPKEIAALPKISRGSFRILTASDEKRSQIDSRCSEATSRTRVLPPLSLSTVFADLETVQGIKDELVLDLTMFELTSIPDFGELQASVALMREPVRLKVYGTEHVSDEVLRMTHIIDFPGVDIHEHRIMDASDLESGALMLLPQSMPASSLSYAVQVARKIGLRTVQLSNDLSSDTLNKLSGTISIGKLKEANLRNSLDAQADYSSIKSLTPYWRYDLPDYDSVPMVGHKIKVLLAGADFKFAGDLVDALVVRRDIDVRVDLFQRNSEPQPEKSSSLLKWADVIIAEFASMNAIWYSHNVQPYQTLIVHLHGYELLSDWIDELNIDAVSTIVVASEFYRNKAIQLKGWPESKIRVVPNSVNPADLRREKLSDSRFHIGLVGMVPVLKRPDRALDLLEALLETDDRYTLHIRGHAPWNYTWEWRKSAHQDSYREFYDRIQRNSKLRRKVSFESFGADMGNWLRKIGWVLSPSTRETFHMAAVEGAMSGAVPIAWRRDGSDEIIGQAFNVESTDDAVEMIRTANDTTTNYNQLAVRAVQYAGRYSSDQVRNLWLELIHEFDRRKTSLRHATRAGDRERTRVYEAVQNELHMGDFEGALSLLDENVKLTAGHAGPLKDLEQFVRGVAQTDSRRLSLFLPGEKHVYDDRTQARILTVRPSGLSSRRLVISGLEDSVLDIDPPRYIATTSGRQLPDDIQNDRASRTVSISSNVRLDHWFQMVKTAIIENCLSEGVNCLLASGPWWVALPTALAADELGIRVAWHIDSQEILRHFVGVKENPSSGHQIAQLSVVTLKRMDQVLISDDTIVTGSRTDDVITASIDPSGDEASNCSVEHWHGTNIRSQLVSAPSQRSECPPVELAKDLSDLRVGIIGDDEFVESVTAVVKETVRIPIKDYYTFLSAELDAVIILSEADKSGPWTGRVSYSRPQAATPAAKIFDRARLLGIPTIFLLRGHIKFPDQFLAAARKADTLIVEDSNWLNDVLSLNPVSTLTTGRWLKKLSLPEQIVGMLRAAGVSVRPFASRVLENVPQESKAYQDKLALELVDDTNQIGLSDLETVTVIVATHGGRERLPVMLESLAKQTLPAHLIRLIVVENGTPDGTQRVIEDFAQRNPSLAVMYEYDPTPSAGNARNIGLRLVQNGYITFVDDDDYLESNYLLSMWLSADPHSVVIGYIRDEDLEGNTISDTPNNRRLDSLNGSRIPLSYRAGLLGLNACKLIPMSLLDGVEYDPNLKSGEDVVFMSHLLHHADIEVVPAAPMRSGMYVRILRGDSISRRDLTFDFAITQRFEVINALEAVKENAPNSARGAILYLQQSQLGFTRNYLKLAPSDRNKVVLEGKLMNIPTPILDEIAE